MAQQLRIVTDSSGLCILDPTCLRHRLNDTPDWWTIRHDLLEEINAGHLYVLDLGTDGDYYLTITLNAESKHSDTEVRIKCSSGRLFIGQAEQIPSDGFEPEEKYGGKFFAVPEGIYGITAEREGNHIRLFIGKSAAGAKNTLELPPSLH